MSSRLRRTTAGPAVVLAALLATAGVAGCGKDDDAPAAKATAKPYTATSAPDDVATTTAPSKSAQPVPSGGPTGIGTFPVPPGATIKGPGPMEKSWQFDISTKDTAAVIDFYRKALPAAGYKVRENVTKNVGAEVVKYDIEFTGKAHGFIVAIPDEDDVFVVVQSPPDLDPE